MRPAAGLLLLALLPPAAGRAEDERPAAPLKALNEAVRKAFARARPSVVRVLVSRSDSYHKAPSWGVPPADKPGRLGPFDAKAAAAKVPADAPNRARALRAIRDHDLSDPAVVPESFGTGVVIHDSGLVLTCAHVVRNATKVYVRLPDKRGSWADVHASDPRSDLAVLRLLNKLPGLKPLKFGPAPAVRKAEFVISVLHPGSPGPRDGGAEPEASWGVVRALRKRAPGDLLKLDPGKVTLHHYGTLIDFGARSSPACSGGVLLNLDGEPVGLINVLAGLRGSSPGGYAIPLDKDMRRIIDTLARGEEVEYGFLGVSLHPNRGDGLGAYIWRVSLGSPAYRAGLMAGDRVVGIDGKPVRTNQDLFLLIGLSPPGTEVRVKVAPPGQPQPKAASVKLAKFYVPAPGIVSRRPPARGGIRVDWLSLLCQRAVFPFMHPVPSRGVLIREVVPGSPADKADLQPDKVITHVGTTAVNTPAEYYKAMAAARGTAELTVLNSDGRPRKVTIDLK